MPDNLFNSDEIGELFTFQEDGESSVDKAMILLDSGVKDDVLIKLVQSNVNLFVSIEDQGSLLEDKPEAHLTADEELAAQDEYEKEIQPIQLIQPILIGVEDQERKNQSNVSTALANSAYIEQVKR